MIESAKLLQVNERFKPLMLGRVFRPCSVTPLSKTSLDRLRTSQSPKPITFCLLNSNKRFDQTRTRLTFPIVFRRLPTLLLTVALACSVGLHWSLLQSVAWTTMLAGNLQYRT
jgi:hypothetical protein